MPDREDDELGYGKPPRWAQFPPGRSGNPKGRPRKKRDSPQAPAASEVDALQRKTLDQQVTVNEGGKTKKLTALEVAMKAQVAQAMKGHALAQREVIRDARELEKREASRSKAAAENEEKAQAQQALIEKAVFEDMVRLRECQKSVWDAALAEGKDEPDFPWPHPDDVLLDHSRQKWRIRGPMEAAKAPHYRWIRTERDAAFVQMVLKARARSRAERCLADIWTLTMTLFDAQLPLRWQVRPDFEELFALHCMLPMRDLRNMLAHDRKNASMLKAALGYDKPDREVYRVTNGIMAPILKPFGYRSLAQFERAYEDTKGNPPWPRKEKASA